LAQAAKLITQYDAGAMGYFKFIMMTPIEGFNQPYEFHDEQWGGLFDSAEAAEKELLRLRPDLEVTGEDE
jgi:hypothetical protein